MIVVNQVPSFASKNRATLWPGSTRELELVLIATEPTKWNAPAFESGCGLQGIPTGIATNPIDQPEHIISTIAYIPGEAANRKCTITGTLTTFGGKYPTTTIEVVFEFEVIEKSQ
jgi:hypothetical protein